MFYNLDVFGYGLFFTILNLFQCKYKIKSNTEHVLKHAKIIINKNSFHSFMFVIKNILIFFLIVIKFWNTNVFELNILTRPFFKLPLKIHNKIIKHANLY